MNNRRVRKSFINYTYTSFGESITMIFYDGHISSGSVSFRRNFLRAGQYYTNQKGVSQTGEEL